MIEQEHAGSPKTLQMTYRSVPECDLCHWFNQMVTASLSDRDHDELRGAMRAWNSHLDITHSPQIFPN